MDELTIQEEHHHTLWKRFLMKLQAILIAGLAVTVPIGLTVWIFIWIFNSIDNILQPAIRAIFGHAITGVGFGVTVVLVLIIGVIATNVMGNRLIRWGESWLSRVPVTRVLYVTLKQIVQSFTNPEKTGFLQVVLIDFPDKGMKTIGFMTNEIKDDDGEALVSVFVPTAPNPSSGFLEIVREDSIIRTNIPVGEALKMVVSGGRIASKDVQRHMQEIKKKIHEAEEKDD